jgi:signal transduction histidine kinase
VRAWKIRWLVLGVSAAVFVLPALSLLALKTYTGYLVRRTEEQLLGQGVLIAETYRDAWRRQQGLAPAPVAPAEVSSRRRPPAVQLLAEQLHEQSPPEPKNLPAAPPELRDSVAFRVGQELEPLLRRAQVFNLSAVRLLDAGGCVVATTRGDDGRCLGALPEVREARSGRYAAVLRARISDEPPPPLESLSRRGDQRLFIALPIAEAGAVIGVVRLSRTAESGLEWVWKNRLPLLGGVALVVTAALLLSIVSAGLIVRPLERMAGAAERVSVEGAPWPDGVARGAPLELAVLGEALAVMTKRLAARATYVAEFAANVSHELKTPLTSIRGAAELLREQWTGMDTAQRDRFLSNIHADAERTEALVRGLLHLARIENQTEAPPAGSLSLGDVQRALLARYPEHVEVQVADASSAISIAPEYLDSALGNLIDNALRYRRRKAVQVTLAVRDGRLHVEVQDDGPGISAANRPRVFERFFTTERDQGGTGLGLAIVQAIAEARGGSVGCESSPEGTSFRLVL